MTDNSLIGMVLRNRYEILEIIGTGGMSTVYKARCNLLNRFVAIKVLHDSLKDDPDIVKKFNKESQAVASLSHHNIVSIYDVGCEGGINYIVMEYVEGITLKEYINKHHVLDWYEACQFAAQIGLALEHAHSKNIIHRDIKPHNILMTRDLTLKVTDFGIAHAVSSETVVMGSATLGSVHYISPEQARGGYTDARSDIYSLGVVLYEMLTGTLPFNGDNAVSVALMHINNEPKDIRKVNPDLPENVAKIVMKAISKEQHARYQTAMEMVTDLRAALSMQTVEDDEFNMTRRVILPEEQLKEGTQMSRVKGKTDSKGKKIKTAQQKKDDKTAAIIAISTVVLIAVIAVGTFLFMRSGTKEIQVPTLINLTLEDAEKVAEAAGFKIDDQKEMALSDDVEEGHVISQDPGANQYSKKKAKIKLVISLGKSGGDIAVPSVVNIDYKDAIKKLTDSNIQYKITEESNSDVSENVVIRQSPESGTKIGKEDIVTLYVSKGSKIENVTVPKVIGSTRAKAESTLKSSDLNLGNVSKEYSDMPIDTVISQNPTAGSESPKNSYVSIVLSKGPDPEPTEAPATEPPPEQTKAPEPTKAPAATNTPAPTTAPKVKTLTVTIPNTGKDSVHVKVVANGKTIHDQNHSISEGVVNIDVAGTKDASVQVYIDGEKVQDKTIKFD